MRSDETVLITGGAGFIGCGVAKEMIGRGARVVVVDALHPQVHTQPGRPERMPEQVELLPFDVTDPVAWDAFLKLERPGTVVHLAAETGTSQSLRESSRHGSTNCVGTTQMLDAFTRAGHVPSHIVLTSSRAVYGEGEWEADGERYRPLVRTHSQLRRGRVGPSVTFRCSRKTGAECCGPDPDRTNQRVRRNETRSGTYLSQLDGRHGQRG